MIGFIFPIYFYVKIRCKLAEGLWDISKQYALFHGEELLAPCPTPKLEDHPFLTVRDCLFNTFVATSIPGAPYRGDKGPNFGVATQLAASHEGLSSMELSSELVIWAYVIYFPTIIKYN
jgi:hypothetical protein